jgi:Tol biopolymer transport system component
MLASAPVAAAPVEQGLELVVPRPIPVEPAPAARTTATAEPFLQRAVPIDARPSAVPTPETVESTLDFPPMAGFINPAPEPADRAAVPLMESRPARREPRLGKLLPRLAPMLDQEFVNASAHSPVEELPPPPPAPAAPTPPAVEERAPSRPWPPPFTAKPEFEPVPPEVTVSALRVKPVEPSPRTATPGRVPYGPGEITYSGGIRTRFILLAAAMLVIVASIIGTALYLARTHTPQVLKFAVPPPEHTSYPGTPAVSPDGKYLAFSASGPEGRRMLWLRPLDALHATVIPGSEGGFAPFWSPDSQYIAFFADKALKKVRASGSTPQTICEAEGFAAGGSWNRDGIILFAPGLAGKLYRVHANGGRPEEVTDLSEEGKERAHLWPRFLPDGKRFTFYCLTDTEETSGVYTGSLNSRTTQRLLQSDSNAVFSAAQASDANPGRSQQGYLLFVRNRGLYGQKFDAGSKDVNGTPFLVAEDVGAVRSMALAPVSVSDNGVLVYQTLGQPTHQLLWFDRFGRQQSAIGEPAEYGEPRISPDGRRVAVSKAEPGKDFADIWVFNEDGSSTRVTSTPHDEGSPVWSPDGSRLAYFSNEEGAYNLYQKSLAGARSEALLRDGQQKYPVDWSGDGRYLIYGAFDRTTKMDLWVLHMGDRRKFSLVQTIAVEAYAVLSPDGRWLAYETSSEGRPEVFVQPFRSEGGGTERHYKISTDGGGHPRWRNDGKEIYYITKSGRLMAAAVRPGDTTFESDAPQVLFQTRPIPKAWNVYDSTADGNRFLVRVPLEWSSAAPITVVTNWTQKVKL